MALPFSHIPPILILLSLSLSFFPPALGQTPPAPAPALDECITQLVNMSDCLTYVEKGSNLAVPDKGCCPELAGMLAGNPICLCKLIGKSESFGVEIDLKRALKLPSVCQIQTPPLSSCSVAGVPVGVPTSTDGPSSSPEISPKGEAATQPGKSGASKNLAMAYILIFDFIFLISFLS